jgi:hypothetical protein
MKDIKLSLAIFSFTQRKMRNDMPLFEIRIEGRDFTDGFKIIIGHYFQTYCASLQAKSAFYYIIGVFKEACSKRYLKSGLATSCNYDIYSDYVKVIEKPGTVKINYNVKLKTLI